MDPVRGVVCYSGLSSIDLFVGDMIQSMLPVTVIRNYHGTESIVKQTFSWNTAGLQCFALCVESQELNSLC